jgi:hypothetical protein
MINELKNGLYEVHQKNKTALMQLMAEHKITKFVASFDGSGDSGQIEDIELYSGETKLDSDLLDISAEVTTTRQIWNPETKWVLHTNVERKYIRDLVEEVAWTPLEDRFGGWEINEGAYGEVIINSDGTGSIECNQRILEVETETCDF